MSKTAYSSFPVEYDQYYTNANKAGNSLCPTLRGLVGINMYALKTLEGL